MILSDADIRTYLHSGKLIVTPLLEPIQPVSIDLRVGHTILVPVGGTVIDPLNGLVPHEEPQRLRTYRLYPNEFVNLATLEWIEVPITLTGFVCGKSSLARHGLQIEAAGLVDPGWKGRLTLEIKNLSQNTIILRPGMRVAQIYFLVQSSTPSRWYGDPALGSHYQYSTTVMPGILEASPPMPDPILEIEGEAVPDPGQSSEFVPDVRPRRSEPD